MTLKPEWKTQNPNYECFLDGTSFAQFFFQFTHLPMAYERELSMTRDIKKQFRPDNIPPSAGYPDIAGSALRIVKGGIMNNLLQM